MTYEEYMSMLKEKIVEVMEKGIIPWQAPWKEPFNGAINRYYDGLNKLYLRIVSHDYGGENRFYTLKQANALGCKVRKGEKAYPVIYFRERKPFEKAKKDSNGNPVLDDEGNPVKEMVYPPAVFQYYRVFNATQLDPVPARDQEPEAREMDTEKADRIIGDSPVPISFTELSRAYYSPISDSIKMPPLFDFNRPELFYSTAFHEMSHSTGPRLSRNLSGRFGDPSYAKEELVAELTALAVCEKSNIRYTNEDSAAYIQSWLSVVDTPGFSLASLYSEVSRASRYLQHPEDRPILRMQSWKKAEELSLHGSDRYLLVHQRGAGFSYSILDPDHKVIKEGSSIGHDMADAVNSICHEHGIDSSQLDYSFFPHAESAKPKTRDYLLASSDGSYALLLRKGKDGLSAAVFEYNESGYARISNESYPDISDPRRFLNEYAQRSSIAAVLDQNAWLPFGSVHREPVAIIETSNAGLFIDSGKDGITVESRKGGYAYGKDFVRIFWSGSENCIIRSFSVNADNAEHLGDYAYSADASITSFHSQSDALSQLGYDPADYTAIDPSRFLSLEKRMDIVPRIPVEHLHSPRVFISDRNLQSPNSRRYLSLHEAEAFCASSKGIVEYTISFRSNSPSDTGEANVHVFNGIFDPAKDKDFLSSIKPAEEIVDRQAAELRDPEEIQRIGNQIRTLSFLEDMQLAASQKADVAASLTESDMAYKAFSFVERQIANANQRKPIEWEGYPGDCPDIGWEKRAEETRKEVGIMPEGRTNPEKEAMEKKADAAAAETVVTSSNAERRAYKNEAGLSEDILNQFTPSPDGSPYAVFLSSTSQNIPLGRRMTLGEASLLISTLSNAATSPDVRETASFGICCTLGDDFLVYTGEAHIGMSEPSLLSQIEATITPDDTRPIADALPVLSLFEYLDREQASAESLLKATDSGSSVMMEFKAYASSVLDFVNDSRNKLIAGDMFRIDDHPREVDFRYMVPENVDINKIKQVYISGPISQNPDYENTFKAAENELRAVGYEVINPVELVKGRIDGNVSVAETWRRAMEMDLSALRSADAMVLLDRNGLDSTGMDIEIHTARISNLPIIAISHAIKAAKESPAKKPVEGLTPTVSISSPTLNCDRTGLSISKANEVLSRMHAGLQEDAKHKVSFNITYTYKDKERRYSGFMYLRGDSPYEGLVDNIERVCRKQLDSLQEPESRKWKVISRYVVPYFKVHQKVEENLQIADENKADIQKKLNDGYSSEPRKEGRKKHARR